MGQFRELLYRDESFAEQNYHDDFSAQSIPASIPVQTKRLRLVPSGKNEIEDRLRNEFKKLSRKWKEDVFFSSSTHKHYYHPSYQRIIGMGKDALPLIIQDLRETESDWFWALQCITGKDPVPKSSWGNFELARNAWLNWAVKNA